jgi:hypothetical protein
MRKKVLAALRQQLNASLRRRFPSLADISDDPSFTAGHIGFRLSEDVPFFFLSVVADEDADSFRLNLAWGASRQYPTRPFRDLRASVDEFVGHETGELQLACLGTDANPWVYYLDEAFGRWKQKLEKAMTEGASADSVVGFPSAQLLASMPKRCSPSEAIAMASVVSEQIAAVLEDSGRRFMGRVCERLRFR